RSLRARLHTERCLTCAVPLSRVSQVVGMRPLELSRLHHRAEVALHQLGNIPHSKERGELRWRVRSVLSETEDGRPQSLFPRAGTECREHLAQFAWKLVDPSPITLADRQERRGPMQAGGVSRLFCGRRTLWWSLGRSGCLLCAG